MDLFGIKGFMPHGYCLAWSPGLLWLTVSSDALMTLAYVTYPVGIAYFVWKRKDLLYRWLYLGFFITFILTCARDPPAIGGDHLAPAVLAGRYVKALSALVAVATSFAIWWVIPRALKLPSPAELQRARDQAEAANKAKSIFWRT
ncbi:hypothetical protein [Methylomonas koyamae]|uniref:hypothetical protein n=1 Tax=Methylomonas koyamae TaxID=702114 RepID=UPI00402B33CE